MELLEREAQLGELRALLREADSGEGRVAFVAGEAGVGKTTLVDEFTGRLPERARVLRGNCDALQTPQVLGPVHEIASVLPGFRRATGADSRDALFASLLAELSRAPVSVVVLEDLHWADEATLDFVVFLGRRIQRTRCLFLATFRDDEVPLVHPLRRTLGELTGPAVVRLKLPALSAAAVMRMAEGSGRDPERLYAVTAGNPFFLRELLAFPSASVPDTVRDAVLGRLSRCSDTAREVAEIVSVSPGRTDTALLGALLREAEQGASECIACGLLQDLGHAVGYRHELARLAVESSVRPTRRRDLHRRVLEVLATAGADLSRLVHHAELAGNIEAALRYAPDAGREAAELHAHREAAAHFAVAVRHADRLPASARADLLERHAVECHLTNQVLPAIDSAGRALTLRRELGDPEGEARALRILSRQYWAAGNKAEADRCVADAIRALEALPPGPDLAMAWSARSQLAMLEGRTDEAVAYGRRALDLARRFDDPEAESHALNNIGSALLGCGEEAGYEPLERSLAIALEHDLAEHIGRAYANLSTCSVLRHDFARAEHFLAEGIAWCEEREIHTHLGYLRAYDVRCRFERGHWADAAAGAASLLKRMQLTTVQRIPTLIVLALVRARRGDPGVEELLEEASALAEPTRELQRIGRVAAARAEQAWYRNDLDGVREAAAGGLVLARGHRDPWIKGELLFWYSRVERTEPPSDVAEPYRLMIAGKWRAAAEAWKRIGMPYERALALSLGPEPALREALELLEELGGSALAAIVRRRLRERGARQVPRGPRPSTRRNPAGLTARELEVLKLLVAGHTNAELARRLHMSVKTAGHHVSAILGKLGVRSRTEAVAAARRLNIGA